MLAGGVSSAVTRTPHGRPDPPGMATASRVGRRWPSGSQSCPAVSLSPTGPGAASARPGSPAESDVQLRRSAPSPRAATGDEAAVASLQHEGEVVAGTAVEQVDGDTRDLAEAPPRRDQVGQAAQEVHLDQAPLDIERGRVRRGERRDVRCRPGRPDEAQQPIRVDRVAESPELSGRVVRSPGRVRSSTSSAPIEGIGRGGATMWPRPVPGGAARLFRGREEALQVAEPIAPIAAQR